VSHVSRCPEGIHLFTDHEEKEGKESFPFIHSYTLNIEIEVGQVGQQRTNRRAHAPSGGAHASAPSAGSPIAVLSPGVLSLSSMTPPIEKSHIVRTSTSSRGPRAPARLTSFEELPLRQFVTEDSADAITVLLRHVNDWADVLCDPATRDVARVEMLATMIATQRAKLVLLETRRDDAIEQRDLGGVMMLEKAIDSGSRRLMALTAEHRLSCSTGQRSLNVTTIAVGHGQQVNVAAGFPGELR